MDQTDKSIADHISDALQPPGCTPQFTLPSDDTFNNCSSERRSRSSSRDYDRSRRDRSRERRCDREERSSNDSFHSRNSHSSRDYDRRSYSRDHYRDRSRDYNRDRTRDRSRERDRDHIREQDWQKEEIPHNTILLKGLAPHISDTDIRSELARYSLFPKEVALMRKKQTGESRGFAYVEFRLLSDAVRWKELTQGVIYFGQFRATLHYFVAKDVPTDHLPNKADWTCAKCGLVNFRKRDLCFKCSSPREDNLLKQRNEGCEEVSNSPSSTLLFRNLDVLTTEERVLSMLGQLTVLPIKNLRVAKDLLTNTSKGFAYVELHSISEAMQLHDLLISMSGNFYVDGRQVTVSYSQRSLSVMNSAASANAASAALAAAQWTNQNSNSSAASNSQYVNESMHIGSNSRQYQMPDVSSYQYDESSGYYYDSLTGFYYDPNTQYYYNSESQQYLYWDTEKSTYLPAPSETTAQPAVIEASSVKASQETIQASVSISSPPVIAHAPVPAVKKETESIQEKPKDKNNQDKVKIAKKVAKEMEKWAKTLNQKKEHAKIGFVVPPPSMEQQKFASTEDAGFHALEKKKLAEKPLFDIPDEIEKEATEEFLVKDKASLNLIATYGGESDSEPELESADDGGSIEEVVKLEEARLIDWTKLACLLCKRQFPTKEVLTKHTQLSGLHRQNVDMLKLSKLSSRQLQELERKESGYRDRAKERREKFGQPDIPPPNRLKSKYMKERKETFIPPEVPNRDGIGSDNIGNKMLKAMGWTEGQGLGKTGQGMSGIIEVQQRVKSAGLGMKGASYGAGAGDSYKDAVRKAMQARYNEIA